MEESMSLTDQVDPFNTLGQERKHLHTRTGQQINTVQYSKSSVLPGLKLETIFIFGLLFEPLCNSQAQPADLTHKRNATTVNSVWFRHSNQTAIRRRLFPTTLTKMQDNPPVTRSRADTFRKIGRCAEAVHWQRSTARARDEEEATTGTKRETKRKTRNVLDNVSRW
ncbi:hypothetical protein K0M31_018163 [Melipona bicolor]|uniref:Uncharacterized protein n=1 Tax=Melipona bicolor TaxID=60889 RepID=A0AA40FD85_9HYME|nr:hypothetical protein K0M31_018163 [Melipona bicolor]